MTFLTLNRCTLGTPGRFVPKSSRAVELVAARRDPQVCRGMPRVWCFFDCEGVWEEEGVRGPDKRGKRPWDYGTRYVTLNPNSVLP